jgi:hypothetical protein
MFDNACVSPSPGIAGSPADCAVFANGLFSAGLHEVYLSAVELAKDAASLIVSTLAANNSAPSLALLNASFVQLFCFC